VKREETEMADIGSGVKKIGPSYPVKPVQPSQRDRKSGQRKKKPASDKRRSGDDGDRKSTIDEYI